VHAVDPGAGQGGTGRGLAALVARREITGTVGKSSLVVFPLPHSDAVDCLRRCWTIIGNLETWQISGTKEMTKLRYAAFTEFYAERAAEADGRQPAIR
jgi:hypothetical protein